MTESNTSTTEGHDKTPVLLTKGKDTSQGGANGGKAASGKSRSGASLQIALVVVALIAIVLAGVVWFQYQTAQQTQQAMLERLDQSTRTATHADQLAAQLQAQVIAQGAGLTRLQATVQGLQDQLGNLDQAFQVITDSGSDLILLNDIEHLVSIANQQVTLGGNVANAIVALETAQARLSRANRPVLASIQQTLNGDLERLRAAAVVDVPAMSAQLEQLNGLLAQSPLLVPDDAVPGVAAVASDNGEGPAVTGFTADPEAPWWRTGLDTGVHWAGQVWSMLRHDLAGFISVRRVDNQSAMLISPEQAGQLRLTLKLRLMTAQLALMMRQPDVWKAELEAISTALQSHFDAQSPITQRAQRLATRLLETPVDTRLPAPTQTMSALEGVRQESSRSLEHRGASSSLDEKTSLPENASASASEPASTPAPAPASEPVSEAGSEAPDAVENNAPASVPQGPEQQSPVVPAAPAPDAASVSAARSAVVRG
ncbi:MAG: uroporphyrinogen-III C-methyltransferase [Pusillimonas sp.]